MNTKDLREVLKRAEALFRGAAASKQADALGKLGDALDKAGSVSVGDFVEHVRQPITPPTPPPPTAQQAIERLKEIDRKVDQAAFRQLFAEMSDRRFAKVAAFDVAEGYTGARPRSRSSKGDVLDAIKEYFETGVYRAQKAELDKNPSPW